MTSLQTFEEQEASYLEFKKHRDECISKLEELVNDLDQLCLNTTDYEKLVTLLKEDEVSTKNLPEFMRNVNKNLDVVEPLIEELDRMAAGYFEDESNKL